MKAVVAAFNQEKALVWAFSVITNLQMELFEALISTEHPPSEDICMNLSSTGLTMALLGSCLSIAMLRIAMEVNTQYGI